MKVRSLNALNEVLNEDLVWRKREIVKARKNVEYQKSDASTRSAVLILYAHWEGFIKKAAEFYLQYVTSKKLNLSQLKPNFYALICRQKFGLGMSHKSTTEWLNMVHYLNNNWQERAIIPNENIFDVNGNLSGREFRKICELIGIVYHSHWQSKEKKIDESLLRVRNSIAHGDHERVTISDYVELEDLVFFLIDSFRNEIENSAAMNSYLR